MAVWRFLPDGALDTSFGGLGFVSHEGAAGGGPGLGDEGYDLVVDGTGRILVTGAGVNASASRDMVTWRFLEDGSFDTSFNGQGWVTFDRAGGNPGSDYGRAIAIDGNGKIIVAGSADVGSSARQGAKR